ncbi:MAG TPA: UPF0147 family protein [Candidatus Nanoarchaeia archaeon]|nr:UPF0147 family protein [Candidatus Nanoarchaeia archaeon]
MNSSPYQEAIDHLCLLVEDSDVSKSFKEKAKSAISILQGSQELAIDKALLKLEEMSFLDLSSYHRTQVWDVISLLESLK